MLIKRTTKVSHIFLSIMLILTITTCQDSQEHKDLPNKFADPAQQVLANLIDTRQAEKIIPYLDTSDTHLRLSAALGTGSLQDSILIEPLGKCLHDSVVQIRKTAAFSLGQIQNTQAFSLLQAQLEKETNNHVRIELWKSIGKTVPDSFATTLIQAMANAPCQELVGWGLYQMTLRGLVTDSTTANLFLHLLDCEQPDARQAFAQFLARSRNLDLTPFTNQIIQIFDKEDHPETKIALALSLRHCKNIHGTDLLDLISLTADERIQQNLLRSGWSTGALLPRDMVDMLTIHHPLVSYSCAQWMANQSWPKPLIEEVELLLDEVADEIKPWLLKGLIQNRSSPDRFVDSVVEAIALNQNKPYLQGDYIRALEASSDALSYIVAHMDTSLPPPLSTAAAETVLNIHRSGKWPSNIPFMSVAKDAFESNDEAILALFAAYIREAELSDFPHIEWLENALELLSLPRQIETYNELLLTIQYLKGEEQIPFKLPIGHPIDWELVAKIPKDQIVRIETAHGNIDIQLFVEETPGSVGSFVSLLKSGFYDGKKVHRVVPNFVIQSGCPRGDGYGSVDYAIRSEFSPRPYLTGSVGMASAGKDTESCQWFITHSPTPHLEGRYSQFAQVVKGMDVMRKIQQGDEIISIKILE